MVAMNDYETYAHEVIAAGADFIVSGAGLPVDLPAYTADSDIAIAPIVSTQKSAHVILKFWDKKYKRTADFIVRKKYLSSWQEAFMTMPIMREHFLLVQTGCRLRPDL